MLKIFEKLFIEFVDEVWFSVSEIGVKKYKKWILVYKLYRNLTYKV